MAKMIGRRVPVGPGGRDCTCCGDAPKHRTPRKRSLKRSERQAFARELRRGEHQYS